MAELDIPRPVQTVHMAKACRDEGVGVDEREKPPDLVDALELGVKRAVILALLVHASFFAASEPSVLGLVNRAFCFSTAAYSPSRATASSVQLSRNITVVHDGDSKAICCSIAVDCLPVLSHSQSV